MIKSTRVSTTLLVILSTFFWGTNFSVAKFITTYISPVEAAAIRFAIASVFILGVLLLTESRQVILKALKQNWLSYLGIGFIGVAGFNGLFFIGLRDTSAINGALIMATNPLLSIMLARLFLNAPINTNQALGISLSLIGIIIALSNGSIDNITHLGAASGDKIILLANVCWALYGVLTHKYLADSPTLITTTLTMIIGTFCLLIFAYFSDAFSLKLHLSGKMYLGILYIALVGTVTSYLFWNIGLKHLGTANTAVYFNLVPIFAIFTAVILGDPLSKLQFFGGIMVLAGILMV